MALVLQQRRLLTIADVRTHANGTRELVLHSAKLKADFVVVDRSPETDRLREIQAELVATLFTDRPAWEADEE
jgi:hypothetical protein